MAKKFVDDEIIHVESDIRKIQIKPTVYISYGGEKGAGHLVKEAINNNVDEGMNPNGVEGPFIIGVHYDENEDTIETSDTGRGIQFESLKKSCTLLQAGSKQSRETGGSSAGENGIGMTAMNALSEMFEIVSYRYGECKLLKFRDGDIVQDKLLKVKNDKHGLTIRMKPSTTFLGSEAKIPIDYLQEWLTRISFLLPDHISIKFSTNRKDVSKDVNLTFKNKDGLKGFMKTIAPKANLFRTPIVLTDHNSILEKDVTVQRKDGTVTSLNIMRDIELSVAMNYNPSSSEFTPYSYCNIIENPQHGFHHIGVKQAYLGYIKKQVKESLTKKESHYEVQDSDILNGLTFVVNLNTTHSTGFSPQTKELLGNQALLSPIRSLATKMFNEFFKGIDGKKYLASIIKLVKNNIELRMSLTKTRNRVKNSMDYLDERSIHGYTAPTSRGKKDYRELYMVEGESAGGGARGGRFDNRVQGVLELRGKIDNILNKPPHVAIKAPEIDKIIKLLRCGIDDHYNEDDLYFQKIIILTDADVDGDHIAALIMLLLIMRAPKVIENGHLYRALTPLYRIKPERRSKKKSKKGEDNIDLTEYVFDKKAYFKLYEQEVHNRIKIKVNENDKFSTSDQMRAFLAVNKEYREILVRLSKQYSCHTDILEYIASHIDDYQETISDFYYELEFINGDTICGPYDGRYNNVVISKPLIKELKKMNDIINNYNNGNSNYHVYQSYQHTSNSYRGYLSIGQIMAICEQYEPNIETRFKGLGEINPHALSKLAMDPNIRQLVQITMDDAIEAVNTFLMLFGDKFMDEKKQLYMDTEITMDDLDN